MHRLKSSRKVILAFLITVLVGAILLWLPVSRTGASESVIFSQPVSGVSDSDSVTKGRIPKQLPVFGPALPGGAPASVALFTAASATCVTGLIVVDTGTYWSPFGQAVLLILFELGGIGTMTVVSLVGLSLRKVTSDTREIASQSLGGAPLGGVKRTVMAIIGFAAAVQVVFATILCLRLGLSGRASWPKSLFYGLFLSDSAFNNAGFTPWLNSVSAFDHDPVVLMSLAALIIIGGLGFPVWAILGIRGPHWWRLNMNARIVLFGTAFLIVAGTIVMALMEWNNPATLGNQGSGAKLLNAFFTAVSPRTAGFNSIDIAGESPATWLVTDVLMIIGAGPAGTAGGLKITTTAVVLATMWGEVRGAAAINILGLRLARSAQRQALSVFSLFAGLIWVAAFLIMLDTPWGLNRSLFEAISALGTVGLSTGITPYLPVEIQALLALLMLVGRLGPLTLATALGTRRRKLAYELPKDYPLIG